MPCTKVKLSVYWPVCILIIPYGHELWAVTERMQQQKQVVEMRFLWRVTGLSIRHRVKNSII